MKKYYSPTVEYTTVIKSGIICESNTGAGMVETGGEGSPQGTPGGAPKRRVF